MMRALLRIMTLPLLSAQVLTGGAPLGQRRTGLSGSIRFSHEQRGRTEFRITIE